MLHQEYPFKKQVFLLLTLIWPQLLKLLGIIDGEIFIHIFTWEFVI